MIFGNLIEESLRDVEGSPEERTTIVELQAA